MNIKQAFASLTKEQSQKIMFCFNELEPMIVLLEDDHFLAVHAQPDRPFKVVEQSQYWLLGVFT